MSHTTWYRLPWGLGTHSCAWGMMIPQGNWSEKSGEGEREGQECNNNSDNKEYLCGIYSLQSTFTFFFFHLIFTTALWEVNRKVVSPTWVPPGDELSLSGNIFKMHPVRNLPILSYIFITLVFLNCI